MGRVHHFAGFFETVREVFVVIDRDCAAILFEDPGALFEKLEARVEDLSFVVAGVVAVLADDQNGVHGEFTAACAERFGDGGKYLEAEFFGPFLTEIAFGFLIDVEGGDLNVGLVPGAVEGVADEEAITHVLGVGEIFVDRGDDRDALRRGLLSEERCGGGGRSGFDEGSACQHQVLQKVDSLVGW